MKPFDEEVYQKYSKLSTEYNKKASSETNKLKVQVRFEFAKE